jgi:two-component system, NtrC family, sensor histidine kinase PilS
VAHEIRNPLAAIAQANALLDEDLEDPRLKRLTSMVSQNAKRLGKIVDDILNVAHVQPPEPTQPPPGLNLNETANQICLDWGQQSACQHRLHTNLSDTDLTVRFDTEHLRRILVNLLDNAQRYTPDHADTIQVHSTTIDAQFANIAVWSHGAPMDQSVERHLFEPFFSSESRSSGLGLFICRELCEGHGASIVYQRNVRAVRGQPSEGNEFVITLARDHGETDNTAAPPTDTPWQTTLY